MRFSLSVFGVKFLSRLPQTSSCIYIQLNLEYTNVTLLNYVRPLPLPTPFTGCFGYEPLPLLHRPSLFANNQ